MHELSVLSLLRNIFESSENKCIAAGLIPIVANPHRFTFIELY